MERIKLSDRIKESEDKHLAYLRILDNLGFETLNIKEKIKLNDDIYITCKKGHSYISKYQKLLVSKGCK